MECDAASFGRERHCQQTARQRVSRNNEWQGGFEVPARLRFIPRATTGGEKLQAKRRALRMTDVASREALALFEKDWLHTRAEKLEIQSGRRRSRLLAASGDQNGDEDQAS